MPLEVLTVNLWGDSPPLPQRMEGLASYLRRERPDVVALQEVADWGDRTLAHALGETAGYATVHHVRTGRLLIPGEGLAILTNLEAEPAPTVALPQGLQDAHPRSLQQLDVVADGGVVRVANTHLAWPLGATRLRLRQAGCIREELKGWSGPVVLAGDLNDVPGSEPLRLLAEECLVDCYAAVHAEDRWTFHPANPYADNEDLLERRVDHVLARGFDVIDAAVVLTGEDAPVVSDHYGVRVTLRLAAAVGPERSRG